MNILLNKRPDTMHRQFGVSLIELMISIVLGLLLLGAATAMTVSSMVMNADSLSSARVNQDLDSVLQIMVNEIRRAGYSGGLFDFATDEDLNLVSASCLLYAYDLNDDGDLDTNEKFGFRLDSAALSMRTECTTGACATSCTAGTWVPLTDINTVTVTTLAFTSVNSKCFNVTHDDNIVLGNSNNYWVTSTADTITFPCSAAVAEGAGTGTTSYVLNSSDIYDPGTFAKAQSGDRLIEARQININVQANLTNDADVVKNQTVAINVRNNLFRTVP